MAENNCYEHQLFDARWLNSYSIPYYNTHINKYYAKSVYDGNIVKRSYSYIAGVETKDEKILLKGLRSLFWYQRTFLNIETIMS